MAALKAALAARGEELFYVGVIALIVVGFLVLRTPAPDVQTYEELTATLASGQPTVVEFYSNT